MRYCTSTLKCVLSPWADDLKKSVFSQNCGLVRKVGVVNVGKDKRPSRFFIGTSIALKWRVVRNSHPRWRGHLCDTACKAYKDTKMLRWISFLFCLSAIANVSGCYCFSCKSVKQAQAHERKMYERSFTGSPSLSSHQRMKTQVVCAISAHIVFTVTARHS